MPYSRCEVHFVPDMAGNEPNYGPSAVVPVDASPDSTDAKADPRTTSQNWWQRYQANLESRLSPTAISVLGTDTDQITRLVFPVGAEGTDFSHWPDTRVRTGMVVGSVQSGKTASMLGVAAKLLDANVDLLILLAGTRVSLWLQTYERLLSQLDDSSPETAYKRRNERLILPQPADILSEYRLDPRKYLQPPLFRHALNANRPIICVVPKEDDHLIALSRFLSDRISTDYLSKREKPYSMVVLDDEADDASVLDSQHSQKITPRLITGLWSGDPDLAETRHANLFATYVAYTATPQANFLQATHNPLSPTDFNAALRVPGASGNLDKRSLSYREPLGVKSFYCGGEIFYERLRGSGNAALCRSYEYPELNIGETETELATRREALRWQMLSDALRAYMVGAAIRALQPGWHAAFDKEATYQTIDEASEAYCEAHTMLIHPSARKDDHFSTARDIIRWALATPGEEIDYELEEENEGVIRIPEGALQQRLRLEEDEWSIWLERFESSRVGLATLPHAPYQRIEPTDWPAVRRALNDRVFPNVRIRVLNSDPSSDERPSFSIKEKAGGYGLPEDCLSIFVAGNVLSRGLTLDGLTTSLFLRGAAEPAADTQMQMQRWFGYRGEFLPICRVFTYSDQLDLFERYHTNDNALKTEILTSMGNDQGQSESSQALVLQGANFVATSKVETRRVPLSPGPRPSVRLVETESEDNVGNNINVAIGLLNDGDWQPLLDDNGVERGRIRTEPVSILTLAETLERLRYSHHDPDTDAELSRRWANYGQLLDLKEPIFRPPMLASTDYYVNPQSCPYSIAAYFRLWWLLSNEHSVPGFYPTDRLNVPWDYSDTLNSTPPEFYLAFRHGPKEAQDARLSSRGISAMTRGRSNTGQLLNTLWGTRGYTDSYFGDELVDYYFHQTAGRPNLQGGATWRPRGHPGLALFHVVSTTDLSNDTIAVGFGLPHGGPDHIAALRS